MDVKSITTVALRSATRAGLVVKKYSPEILTVTGIVGVVGSTVLACKSTLKVEDVLDEHAHNQEMIESVHDGSIKIPEDQSYSETDYKKDCLTNKVQTAVKIGKLYAPAIILGTASIGCILGGHYILSKRNVALLSAYKLADETLKKYRDRVVKELGVDMDKKFYYGVEEKEVTETVTQKNGKTKEVTKKVEVANNEPSRYARFFDELNPNWDHDPSQNKYFLECVQNLMNDTLKTRGHIFLNEVYDALGMQRSKEGAVVGWIYDKNHDGYVDFNVFDGMNREKREFVNEYEPSILLDFNVDGVIYDLI
jgi:hypothetical protein